MRYVSFASGSSGNCGLLRTERGAVLLDAGISMKRVKAGLAQLGLTLDALSGILVTHEHSDHICGLRMLTKYSAVPVYASGGTARALLRGGLCAEANLHALPEDGPLCLGGVTVQPIPTPHDAAEPVGYRLEADGAALALLTDLGYLPEAVVSPMLGCDAAIVELNHDIALLRNGPYPAPLKRRILGNFGHLSNELGAELAVRLAEAGARQFLLAHLSAENNRPELALAAARRKLGPELSCSVAPHDGFSAVLTLE